MGAFDIIYVIFAFVLVMLILLFTTKYLAYKSKKILKGNYMQIIESLSLGTNNRIHLIKVDKQFFIVSSTNKSVEFLASVEISDFEEAEITNPMSGVADFTLVLKKYLNGVQFGKKQSKAETADNHKSHSVSPDDTFRNNLEKLKNLNKSMNSQRSENEKDKEI